MPGSGKNLAAGGERQGTLFSKTIQNDQGKKMKRSHLCN
jgi:hypothetical protein